MPPSSQTPSRRDDLLLMLLHGGAASTEIANRVIDTFEAEVRSEVAADIHRAELPEFPAGETPENVAKVVRAVDVRIADMGYAAPYFTPAADEPNTLPAWLYERFAVIHGAPAWDRLDDGQRTYWEHHAAAVQRAVARGGFKAEAGES